MSCASNQPDNQANGQNSNNPATEQQSTQTDTQNKSESSTNLNIQYANKSSKISMDIDVNSQDINLEMSGGSMPPLTTQENETDESTPKQKEQDSATTTNPSKKKSDQDWDDVMDIAKNENLTKGDAQTVLAEIRKAQEFFYQKRYCMTYFESLPDFVMLAEAYGHVGMRIEKPGDVEGALRQHRAVARQQRVGRHDEFRAVDVPLAARAAMPERDAQPRRDERAVQVHRLPRPVARPDAGDVVAVEGDVSLFDCPGKDVHQPPAPQEQIGGFFARATARSWVRDIKSSKK